MDGSWKQFFVEWSKTDEFKRLVKKTEEQILRIADKYERPAILFSGGKDSTVGVHITTKLIPVRIFHYDYRYNIPRDIYREILDNLNKICHRKEIVIYTEKYYVPDDRGFFSALADFVRKYHIDCIISCLRKEESSRRKVLTKKKKFMGVANEHILRNWTWKDIWAYIVSKNIPYVSVYDKYAELEGWDRARFTAFFSEDLEYLGKPNVDKFLMWRYNNRDYDAGRK